MSVDIARVKYRRPLNDEQKLVLGWLYKHRFSTSKQIASRLDKTGHKAVQKRLQILEEQGFIGKRYEKSYKLAGRPAEYYLTPKGAKQVDNHHELVIKALYKNKTVSDNFVRHCLNVVDVALKLRTLYGDKIHLFTRYTLMEHEYFPDWMPDLVFQIKNNKGEMQGFLDVWDDTKPFFVQVRKARNYITYLNEGNWPDIYQYNPVMLTVCQNQKNQKKLNRQIRRALYEEDDDQVFITTALQELMDTPRPTQKIWQQIDPDDEPERIMLESLI